MAERKLGLGNQPAQRGSFQYVPGADGRQPAAEPPQFAGPPEEIRQQVPGGPNSLPLPVGRPVAVNAATLTPKERADLEAIGWKPGMAIPSNLAEWIDKAKKEATDPNLMPPPTDPATAPLKMPEIIDIKDLPESKRLELEQVLQQAELQRKQMQQEAASMPQQPAQGVAEAIRAAEGGARRIEIDDDVSNQPPKPPQKPVPDLNKPIRQQLQEKQDYARAQEEYAAAQAQAAESKPEPGTSTTPQPVAETAPERKQCPNCSWDLNSDDVIDISDQDRQNFLAATLGGKPFQKVFEMLGGSLQITIRSLQYAEVDACYRQCYDDRNNNQIANTNDFIEQLNRYRLCLQLVEIRSGEDLIRFPESLEAWGGTGDHQSLPAIFEQVFGDALKSETMTRMVTKCMARFNRVLARLEANCDNENFWKATGSSS